MKSKVLDTHCFIFNKSNNSGEQLILTTQFLANGDSITKTDGVLLNQELTLHSYCNEAKLVLYSALLTPDNLRELANQLESVRNEL